MVDIIDIKKFFRGFISLNEPLGKYTSFQIGGPADFYLEPADKADVVAIVTYLQQQRLPYLILGKGSNMLVSDDGVRGAVINLESGLSHISVSGNVVTAEAGLSLARFVDFCIHHSLQGVEMLPGIPGTIGGAVVMNAGAYGGEISDHLVTVEVLRKGNVTTVSKQDSGFSYRHSNFQGDIILGATFQLAAGDKQEIMKNRRDLLIKRNRAQPVNFPNSGSMFKNPKGGYAAKLIEEAGLKGKRIGNAQISEKHANFIVNHGNATAEEVLSLIELAKSTVAKKFNIDLELEVKLVGFDEQVERQVYE
ncbi:MAG TPA: UDP-N-acetylmuramate dehydrogenase [Bacteroidota bacterium]|nr:UDP-N-acetylmuramate dehydrogenase [Bacteroidota bacterium]